MGSYEYASKTELAKAIHSAYLLLDSEFDGVPEDLKDLRIPEVDKTPAEILAYQLGWMNLVMEWDRDEVVGRPVVMPAHGYRWNQLGALNQSFYAAYAYLSLAELRDMLRQTEERWLAWIDSFSDEQIFTQDIRKWAGEKPCWPIARWIHVNSAAPFKTFRAKMRRWKKYRGS